MYPAPPRTETCDETSANGERIVVTSRVARFSLKPYKSQMIFHCMQRTACNGRHWTLQSACATPPKVPSHKIEARRPCWSSPAVERQSLLWPPAKTSVHFVLAHGSCADVRAKTRVARGIKDRARRCVTSATMSLLLGFVQLQAPTMVHAGRNIGTKNKIRTRVEPKGVKSLRKHQDQHQPHPPYTTVARAPMSHVYTLQSTRSSLSQYYAFR